MDGKHSRSSGTLSWLVLNTFTIFTSKTQQKIELSHRICLCGLTKIDWQDVSLSCFSFLMSCWSYLLIFKLLSYYKVQQLYWMEAFLKRSKRTIIIHKLSPSASCDLSPYLHNCDTGNYAGRETELAGPIALCTKHTVRTQNHGHAAFRALCPSIPTPSVPQLQVYTSGTIFSFRNQIRYSRQGHLISFTHLFLSQRSLCRVTSLMDLKKLVLNVSFSKPMVCCL